MSFATTSFGSSRKRYDDDRADRRRLSVVLEFDFTAEGPNQWWLVKLSSIRDGGQAVLRVQGRVLDLTDQAPLRWWRTAMKALMQAAK